MNTTTISDNYFENVIGSIPGCLIVVNSGSLIKIVNQATLKLLGYREDELIEKPLEILFVKEEKPLMDSWITEFVKTGNICNVQKVFKSKDEREIPVLFSGSKMRDNGDNNRAIVCIASDITEIRKREAELQKAREKAEDAAMAKSEYMAKMSHEIRTNMNTVVGMTSLLSEADELNKDHRQYVETVRDSAIWLVTLINDILDFSKIEAGKMEIKKIDFDLRTTVEGVALLFAQNAEEKGIELACLIHSNLPIIVRSDPWRLRQILINLVSNALSYTERGEVLIQSALLEETETHATIRFVVSDTGIGISRAELKDLFKPFSQAGTLTNRKYGGTGLGLTISKQLCDLMGGEIGVESEEGKGSKFWFTIPLEKQTGIKPMVPLSLEQVRRLNVLIVADKDMNYKVLAHYFSSWGCKYDRAANAAEAMDKLRKGAETLPEYQLALIDSQSTDIAVKNLAQTIKDDPLLRKIRLILLTSLAKRGDASVAQKAGFSAFLTKPIQKDQLFNCVAAVMGFRYTADKDGKPDLITRHSLMEYAQHNRARLLLVEDNVVNQTMAVTIMEKAGYHVDIASTGLEAVKSLKKHFYDAVLMDCKMPEMDGYEATREIRKLDGFAKHVPIIAVTATDTRPGDREKCLDAGMDDYLIKPFKPKELLDIISKWLDDEPVSGDTVLPSMEGKESDNEVFNKEAAMNHVDSDIDLLKKLARQFLEDYPKQLAKISRAIKNNDSKTLIHAVHAIKGPAGNLYARSTVNAASRLEKRAYTGAVSEVEEAYNMLEKEIAKLNQALETFVDAPYLVLHK